MMRSSWTIIVAAALLAGGCKKETPAPTPAAGPPATPATVPAPAATAPMAAESSLSSMRIDKQTWLFPPAQLMLEKKGRQLSARLYSEEPPAGEASGYGGNFFYLDMPLEVAGYEQLGKLPWRYKNTDTHRQDSSSGIFLEGGKQQLQPADITVEFDPSGKQATVYITGQFYQYGDNPDQQTAVTVPVSAKLLVQVVQK